MNDDWAVTSAQDPAPRHWWETRWMVALVFLFALVPLLYPPVPPLVDLLGHMGRYRVELDIATNPHLQRYYDVRWLITGNLGVDVLVMGLAPLIGLEPAVKLVVMAIPALSVAGFLWVAREVHGRIPPTAYVAVPFAFNHPFMFGFVNFTLSMGLAFVAFGLWLRLTRLGRFRLREILFVPISIVIFFCHAFGWGVLGLLAFSAEAVRLHDRGGTWYRAAFRAALAASVMALPIIVMVAWREGSAGQTSDWFNWMSKWRWVTSSLRDRWEWFDKGTLAIAALVIAQVIPNPRLTFSRNLVFSAIVLSVFFILIPRILFGSAYADMRLAPYIFATLILAIRFKGPIGTRLGSALAVIALMFCVVRLGGVTASLAIAANDQTEKLKVLEKVPQGAAVLTMVNLDCRRVWELGRNGHIGAMVVVRKNGFSNDQWLQAGLNMLQLKYRRPGYFALDPSEIVRPPRCRDRMHLTIDEALERFQRDDFDYVWLVDTPTVDAKLYDGMTEVARAGGGILYQVSPGVAR